jgi:hypothetical protein
MNNLEKIIDIIRSLREDSPTMSAGNLGFTHAANPKGPVAGYDKPIYSVGQGKTTLDFRRKIPKKLPPEYQQIYRRKPSV